MDSRAALIVVDMQNGFLNDHTRHLVPVVADLVDQWTKAGRPVVFTRYLNYPGSPFERLIHWTRLRDAPETDLAPELHDRAHRAAAVIDKPAYSWFTPEGIALAAAEGWRDLIFCGVATESCVLKSAVDAFERDFTPWVVTDACASDAGPDVHDAGLRIARRFIGAGQLITTAQLLARLTEPAPD
ncbi:isochorismatase family cysteine hydrolase [Kitasatospora sp. MAP5-34]|uniref:isochorismatase family cysteine hydrolase n=1 Tax=Kitasatospora sp. MAP5-34 TaxID=3035102 RepID=UPI0024761337|nr:isochorismatase family cysteine hydrolase [Kitasatospora sp. MAP5-34]MDH6579500.1 nicotinamidase-related amidase [Kitasatospora sp. MAP5-34]